MKPIIRALWRERVRLSPKDAPVYNLAFDVTPAKLIKGFITENGIINNGFRYDFVQQGGWLSG